MPRTSLVLPMDELWSKAVDSLKEKVGQQNFDIWIKPIHLISVDDDKLELEVPNRFFKEWINEHYSAQIRDTLSDLIEKPCQLQFRIRNEKMNGKDFGPSALPGLDVPPVLHARPLFNPKYTFDHFVVGASNQFAHAACLAVANLPAKNYNPLFIYGGVGL